MDRIQNDELGRALTAAAGERFVGDEGMQRLAGLVARRTGFAVSASSVRSYLNGHRTPPMPTAIALCEELDLGGDARQQVVDLVIEHARALRARRAPEVA